MALANTHRLAQKSRGKVSIKAEGGRKKKEKTVLPDEKVLLGKVKYRGGGESGSGGRGMINI